MNKIPACCPSCKDSLVVTELACKKCATSIKGEFFLPGLAALSPEGELFLKVFLESRGSIKEMEKRLNISYPTVRAKIEQLLQNLGLGQTPPAPGQQRLSILEKLNKGQIKINEALKNLKDLGKEETL
ncbi:DUF2089 domain-containing protein [Planctomycetota bacterium]